MGKSTEEQNYEWQVSVAFELSELIRQAFYPRDKKVNRTTYDHSENRIKVVSARVTRGDEDTESSNRREDI